MRKHRSLYTCTHYLRCAQAPVQATVGQLGPQCLSIRRLSTMQSSGLLSLPWALGSLTWKKMLFSDTFWRASCIPRTESPAAGKLCDGLPQPRQAMSQGRASLSYTVVHCLWKLFPRKHVSEIHTNFKATCDCCERIYGTIFSSSASVSLFLLKAESTWLSALLTLNKMHKRPAPWRGTHYTLGGLKTSPLTKRWVLPLLSEGRIRA